MTKTVKILIIAVIIIIITSLAVAFWPKELANNGQPVTNQPAVNQPITNNPEPTATTTEPEIITSDIDTSDWQTYRNEEYGFELKYPKTWKYNIGRDGFTRFTDEAKKVYVENGEEYLIGVDTLSFDSEITKEEYIKNWKEYRIKDEWVKSWIKNIKIDGLEAIQGYYRFGLSTIIVDENKIYQIVMGSFPIEEYPAINIIYDKILNSFKIIS